MANSLNIDARRKYFIGAQYIHGAYEFTDKSTGEVKSGTTNKWVLTFLQAFDRGKNNAVKTFGSDILTFNVKPEALPYIFGKDEKTFKEADMTSLIGCMVHIDAHFDVVNGSIRASLVGVEPVT